MASISALPNEILEEVLLKLDGRTFTRSRRVCQLWKDIIDNLEKHADPWLRFCEELPKSSRTQIVDKGGWWRKKENGDLSADWKSVYSSWVQAQKIQDWHPVVHQRNNAPNVPFMAITCSGDCAITGHANGQLSLWSWASQEFLGNIGFHTEPINELHVIDLCHDGPHVLTRDLQVQHDHILSLVPEEPVYIHSLSLDGDKKISKPLSAEPSLICSVQTPDWK
ncbi:unnamed protein product [Darwinula stevensoni]|uniref:F-box domain-containing protein n=1 Tax=Darwinula stevensoni TaxID=69355 RepID=A0A7R8X5K1_9CRUS|nr:unnamed protein product [Darwinula stevensoni]CAG0887186.1 unnamed protein product [Darwinula stevensoni]